MTETSLLTRLRQMILEGELAPGERLTETALAERLGVSRTPIRNVLPALAADGFLQVVGRRGFAVAAFSDKESLEALELRALLEGEAARTIARRGAPAEVLEALDACLAEGDAILRGGRLADDGTDRYGEMNARFHAIIIAASGLSLLPAIIDRLNRVPFVSPSSMAFDRLDEAEIYGNLFRGHGHHHAIVEALRHRDALRAEMLFREHANEQRHSLFDRRFVSQME
jgi:GntR family transcriptional regulator, vanillate catabolism transcriptional regulator